MIKNIVNHQKASLIAISIIIILHVVGLVGIGVLHSESIVSLTWINLTVTFAIGLLFFETKFKHILVPLLLASLIGLLTEGIGVNSGYLFGEYKYGSVLGFKIYEVPFTIGLLWAGLNVAAKNFAERITKNPWLIAIVAASIMVLLDIVMEPVAIKLEFWSWDENVIPIFNYVTWFFVSLFIQILWRNVTTKNTVFNSVFIIQAIFFIALNILL
ncbi:MAG: carotenoid biosynthesis protein [Crocinitomicaceae bacterium]